VIGVPRSGTTLLGLRLNKVPGVFSALENNLLRKVIADQEAGGKGLEQTKMYLRKVLQHQDEFPFMINDRILERCDEVTGCSVQEIMIALLNMVRFDKSEGTAEPHRYIVEKNPGYSLLWRKIRDYFPAAKFIWMTRDPRAFVNSRLEKVNPKNRVNNPYFLGYLWNEYHAEYLVLKEDRRVLSLRYEDLVNEPEELLQSVVAFLDWEVDFEISELLEAESYTENMTVEGERKRVKYEDLERKINAHRTDAWKTILSKRLAADIAYLCSASAKKVGYEISHDLTFGRKFYLAVFTFHWYLGAKLFVRLSKKG
jgi:hypothetical protein